MDEETLLPPPPKKVSSQTDGEDSLPPPPPIKKKTLDTTGTSSQDFTETIPEGGLGTPLSQPSLSQSNTPAEYGSGSTSKIDTKGYRFAPSQPISGKGEIGKPILKSVKSDEEVRKFTPEEQQHLKTSLPDVILSNKSLLVDSPNAEANRKMFYEAQSQGDLKVGDIEKLGEQYAQNIKNIATQSAKIKADPTDYNAKYNLATNFADLGKTKEANIVLDGIMLSKPDYTPAYYQSAFIKASNGDVSGAIGILDKGIENNPADATLYNNRANLKIKAGDMQGAVKDLDAGIEFTKDPHLLETLYTQRAQIFKALSADKTTAQKYIALINENHNPHIDATDTEYFKERYQDDLAKASELASKNATYYNIPDSAIKPTGELPVATSTTAIQPQGKKQKTDNAEINALNEKYKEITNPSPEFKNYVVGFMNQVEKPLSQIGKGVESATKAGGELVAGAIGLKPQSMKEAANSALHVLTGVADAAFGGISFTPEGAAFNFTAENVVPEDVTKMLFSSGHTIAEQFGYKPAEGSVGEEALKLVDILAPLAATAGLGKGYEKIQEKVKSGQELSKSEAIEVGEVLKTVTAEKLQEAVTSIAESEPKLFEKIKYEPVSVAEAKKAKTEQIKQNLAEKRPDLKSVIDKVDTDTMISDMGDKNIPVTPAGIEHYFHQIDNGRIEIPKKSVAKENKEKPVTTGGNAEAENSQPGISTIETTPSPEHIARREEFVNEHVKDLEDTGEMSSDITKEQYQNYFRNLYDRKFVDKSSNKIKENEPTTGVTSDTGTNTPTETASIQGENIRGQRPLAEGIGGIGTEAKGSEPISTESTSAGVNKKSLLSRVYEGKTPDEIKTSVEKHGLNYDIETHPQAERMASNFVKEVGIDNALAAVRDNQVEGGAAPFVWATAIDAVHKELLNTKDPELRMKLSDKETALVDEFDKKARSSGRFGSALQAVYQVSDLGYKLGTILNRAKEANNGEGVSDILKNRLADLSTKLDDVNKKVAELESKTSETEVSDAKIAEEVDKVVKGIYEKMPTERKKKADKVIAALDGMQEKLRKNAYSSIVPIPIIDAGISVIKSAIRAGVSIADAIELGISHIKERHGKEWAKEDNFRKDILEELKSQNIDLNPETKSKDALDQYKASVRKSIERNKKRLAEKDFTPKKKSETPIKDKEAFDLLVEKNKLKDEIDLEIEKLKLKNRTLTEKVENGFIDVLNLPKSLMASADMSAPLRQGAILSVKHPALATKAGIEMIKQAFSQEKATDWLARLKASPEYEIMQKAGLYVAEPTAKLSAKEEQFISNIAHKIPIWGTVIKGSERAYSGYLNKLRVDVFSQFHDGLVQQGFTGEKLNRELESFADFVNNATGRGNLGRFEDSAAGLNAFFFSPRYAVSRFNLINPYEYIKMAPKARAEALKTLAVYIGMGSTVLYLAKAAGAGVNIDPRSSDFGKIRIGNTRFDIWSGLQQWVRLIAQLVTGERTDNKGKVKELGKGYKPETRLDLVGRFLRYKTAPATGFVLDVLSGSNALGEPNTFKFKDLDSFMKTNEGQLIVPLWLQDLNDAAQDNGVGTALKAARVGGSFFGLGVQTYDENKAASERAKKAGK